MVARNPPPSPRCSRRDPWAWADDRAGSAGWPRRAMVAGRPAAAPAPPRGLRITQRAPPVSDGRGRGGARGRAGLCAARRGEWPALFRAAWAVRGDPQEAEDALLRAFSLIASLAAPNHRQPGQESPAGPRPLAGAGLHLLADAQGADPGRSGRRCAAAAARAAAPPGARGAARDPPAEVAEGGRTGVARCGAHVRRRSPRGGERPHTAAPVRAEAQRVVGERHRGGGAEPWTEAGGESFCRWDLWFLALWVGEHAGDRDAFEQMLKDRRRRIGGGLGEQAQPTGRPAAAPGARRARADDPRRPPDPGPGGAAPRPEADARGAGADGGHAPDAPAGARRQGATRGTARRFRSPRPPSNLCWPARSAGVTSTASRPASDFGACSLPRAGISESVSPKAPGTTQRTGSYLADWAASRDRLAGLGNAAGAGCGLGPVVLVAQAYAANAHVTRYPDRPHGFDLVSRALPGPCWPCDIGPSKMSRGLSLGLADRLERRRPRWRWSAVRRRPSGCIVPG